jgi:hypothetical protein
MRNAVVGLLLLAGLKAYAAERLVLLAGDATCPAVDDVGTRLGELHASARRAVAGDAGAIWILDEGKHFKLLLPDGVARTFDDDGLRCVERARTAAVAILLWLENAELQRASAPEAPDESMPAAPSEPRAATTPATPTVAPAARPTAAVAAVAPSAPGAGWRRELELEGFVGAGTGGNPGDALASGGGALRFALGRELGSFALAGFVEAGLAAQSTTAYTQGAGTVFRVPFAVGARAIFRSGRFEPGFDGAFVVQAVRANGANLPSVQESWGAEWGGRFGAFLRAWVSERVAPALRVEALYVPYPHPLGVGGAGVVGRLPPVWLSAAAGVAVAIP